MKDQPWHLNQTWPVGRKWCRFTNASENFAGLSPKILGAKKKVLLLFHDFRTQHRISPEKKRRIDKPEC